MIAIDLSDLATVEVRAQYVTPLIQEILDKSSLINVHAAVVAIDGVRCGASTTSGASPVVNTLFQEIASEHSSTQVVCEKNDGTLGDDKSGSAHDVVRANTRCYAEILEEASALCAYMTPREMTIVATVATAATLSFLIPQCHFQGFLKSYFSAPAERASSNIIPAPVSSLEERLVNAMLSNHNSRSGGVFPYSASRMRSLVQDDDGFTTSSFHRFLVQGLRPYLTTGMAFNWLSKESTGSSNIDDSEHGISYSKVFSQAGVDLIQLLAMSISPNSPSRLNSSSLSMEADMGAGGEPGSSGVSSSANSTLQFSFQLSYSDRLQLVKLCAELAIPEREDSVFEKRYNDESNSSGGNGNGGAISGNIGVLDAMLHHLRTSLFEYASYLAHSEKDSKAAYNALTNVAIYEGNISSVQFEFQRLLHATLESRSEYLTSATGDCMADIITKYNGSRYYADGAFIKHAIGLLGKSLNDMIQMGMKEEKGKMELSDGITYISLVKGNSTKRQRTWDSINMSPSCCKAYHFLALLKATRPLFYFLLKSNATDKVLDEDEEKAKSDLIGDVTSLLSYPLSLEVVQYAAQLLALALSYHGEFMDKSYVKRVFTHTRQALDIWKSGTKSTSLDIVKALKPLILTASRHSGTFAFSLLSYAVKICSESEEMAWNIVTLIGSTRPLLVCKRLSKLKGTSPASDNGCEDILKAEIMARLSSTRASYASDSSETIECCISLAKNVSNHWTLYQLVSHAFITSNFSFAYHVLKQRRFIQQISRQTSILWFESLSKLAKAEEVLGNDGAIGISDSLESLHSCQYTLKSLAALEENYNSRAAGLLELGKFGFQLEFLRLRIDFLNLSMITRSLCSEMMVTGGNISARSGLFQQNLGKSFGILASRYRNLYLHFGLHYCQKTRSVLRTLIAMCQFMNEFVDALSSSDSKRSQGSQDYQTKGDVQCAMGSLLVRLRVAVSEKIEKTQAPDLLDLLDTVMRCPQPFPPGFFCVKPIPCTHVNLSVDSGLVLRKQNEQSGVEVIDLAPGVPLKLILSGVIAKEFIKSSNMCFSQIIAWKSIVYDGQLYEEDDAEENTAGGQTPFVLTMPSGDPFSTALHHSGHFILPITCESILQEGFYKVEINMGCRDVRCSEWLIPLMKPIAISVRVEDYNE